MVMTMLFSGMKGTVFGDFPLSGDLLLRTVSPRSEATRLMFQRGLFCLEKMFMG